MRAAIRSTSLLASLWLAAVGRTASADVTGLTYDADSSCPDREAFVKLVEGQAPSLALEPWEANPTTIVVRLSVGSDESTGRLEIRRPPERPYVREIHGSTCAEVSTAVAFVTALALKGQRDEALPEPPRAPAAPAPQPEEPPAPRSSLFDNWALGVSGELGSRAGLAPLASPIEQIGVELRSRERAILSPIFRLALLRAEPVTRIDRFGTTRFTWLAARAAACPVRFSPIAIAAVLPCAGIDAGSIDTSGTPATSAGTPGTVSSVWIDVFAAVRLDLQLLGPVFATAQGELAFPATQYRFAFDPSTPVYDIPSIGGGVSAGLLVQFP